MVEPLYRCSVNPRWPGQVFEGGTAPHSRALLGSNQAAIGLHRDRIRLRGGRGLPSLSVKEQAMGKILLIDDEPTYCEHIALLLAGAGHVVRTAANGYDGLLVGLEFFPDLLITDWALGERYSGGEIAGALRKANPAMRTLLITGNPEVAAPVAGPAWVVDEIIAKPFNRADILAAVVRLLPACCRLANVS